MQRAVKPNHTSDSTGKKQDESYPTHFSTMPSSKFSAGDSRGRSWPGLPMNFKTLPRNSCLRIGSSNTDKASIKSETSLSNIFVDGVGLSASYRSIIASHPNIDTFNTHPSDHKNPKKNTLSPNMSSQENFSTGHRVLLAQWNSDYQAPISVFSVTPAKTPYSKEKNLDILAVTGHIDGSILLYKINPPSDEDLLISNTDISDNTDSFKKFNTSLSHYVISFGPLQQVTSTHFVSTQSDLPFVSQTFWSLFTGTEQGEILKWDCRDGRCLARLSPAAQFALKGKSISQLITVGTPLPTFLLCSSPGILVALNCDNLELVVDLSNEAKFDMILALPSISLNKSSKSIAVPIIAKGHSLGDLSLGVLTLPSIPGLPNIQWKCALSLPNFEYSEWSLNTRGPTDDFERILLISKKSFVLVQIDSTNMIRQLTQYITPPSHEAWADGSFFADNRLVVRTLSGDVHQYVWGLDGSLAQIGEIKGLCGFPIFPVHEHLIGLCPSSSGLQLAGWRLNSETSNEIPQKWLGPVIETTNFNQDTFPSEDKKCLNNEHTDIHSTVIIPVTLGSEHKIKDWIAKGLSCGTISIQPLSQLFFTPQNTPRPSHKPSRGVGFEENNEKWLIGHKFAITSLFEPTPKRLGEKLFLVSGDALGMVKLWELSSGVCLASFQGHSQAVSLLFQLPISQELIKTNEIQSLVISVGLDNSIAVFCLKSMICLGLIPGHTHSIHRIFYSVKQVKDNFSMLHIKYEDEYISQWYLSRNGLTMVPNEVRNFEWVCGIEVGQQHTNVDRKATVVTYPHWDMYHEYPALQVVEVDVRRLLGDLHSNSIPSIRFLTRVESIFPSGSKSSVSAPSYSSSSLLKGASSEGNISSDRNVASAISYSIVSALFDSTFSSKLSNHSSLLQGTRGAGGMISFLINSKLYTDSQLTYGNPWFLSPRFTASRLLPSMALSLKLIGDDALKEGCRLLDSDPSFQIPCLGVLARYWVDASPEIQHASQTLFRTLISQLEYTRQGQLADFWIAQLPNVVPEDLLRSSSTGSAVLVLGILATNYPELLSDSTTLQRIARGLEWLLSPHARATFRMVAIDVVSKGFMSFEDYLDGVWVLRTLYALKEEAPRLARQAVLSIATANTPLFITSLGLATGLSQLSAIMKLLPYIIQQRQTLLFPYIPRVVEIIVKALDPKDPDIRHHLLPAATQCLHDLVATYANVDFHSGSQRLAVGAMEGAAIVYDLRTSTRCLVVEGYVTPTTAVSFSPDGKFLATFAHQESLVKIWNTSGGLLDMLSKSLRGHSPAPIPASPSRTRSPSSLAAVFLPGYLNVNTQNSNSTISAPASGRASPIQSSNSSLLNVPPALTSASSPLNFFSSAPTPYRTFNVSLESRSPPTSPGVIMRTIELHFVGDRSLNLVTDGLNLSFNI